MPVVDYDSRYREFKQADWLRIRQQRLVDELEQELVLLYQGNAVTRDRLRQQAAATHQAAQPAAVTTVPIYTDIQLRRLQTERFRRHVEDVQRGNQLRTHSPAVLQAAFELEGGIRLTRAGPLPPTGLRWCATCHREH